MKKGFTLIELLIVVLIIGILSAVALPQYQKAVTKAHLANLKLIVENVIKNAEEYYLANGVYPTTVEDLTVQPPVPISREVVSKWEWSYYDWGYCRLDTSSNDTNFWCYNDISKIGYGARALHSVSKPGQRSCSVFYPRPAAAVKVCQTETGKKTPYGASTGASPGGWDSYAY